jgi:diacylglycerol kinase family enzyme
MKHAKLLHNPGAGEGEHSKRNLISTISAAGYECSYSSTKKKGWEKIGAKEADFLVLAGGDGTIRKAAKGLLQRKLIDKKLPIGLIPLGTANNIAKTLGVSGSLKEIVDSWNYRNIKRYDIGRIFGLPDVKFFLEGFGYGVFPKLMSEMEKEREQFIDTPEKSIKRALELLHKLVEEAEEKFCRVVVDGIDHSGKFFLVEVMNIRSIGPNLHLAPDADPGDGQLEVVLMGERERSEFAAYILNRLNGKTDPYVFKVIRAKTLQVYSEEKDIHVDDQGFLLDQPVEIKIEIHEGVLEFFVPPAEIMEESRLSSTIPVAVT